jgi:diguanylate cyclase (GGDEF)-like protein
MIALQLAHDAAMQQVAEQAAQLAAANASLEHLASTDPLTGLFNRRHVDRELSRICSFARRRREPVSVVVLDVDHFKTINDTFGHGAGDDVLAGIAGHLRRQTRDEDVIGRLGGDEFVLILAATDRTGAEQLAERVWAAIGTAGIDTGAGPAAVTVSVGVATGDGSDPGELLRNADAALYAQGRRTQRCRHRLAWDGNGDTPPGNAARSWRRSSRWSFRHAPHRMTGPHQLDGDRT